MLQLSIPKNKDQFDKQIIEMRQSLKENLPKKDQHLMNHLPVSEGQIYRRMNSSCPVLWVAPHGFFGDAIYSDYIGIFAAQMMAGSCLVNNKNCRCPLPEHGYGEIANLNDPEDPNPYANAFYNKLKSATSIIRLKSGQIPFVVILLNQTDKDVDTFEIFVGTSDEKHDSPGSEWIAALKKSMDSSQFNINFIAQHLQTSERTLFSYLYHHQLETGPLRLVQIRFNCHLLTDKNILPISSFLSRALSYASLSNNNDKQLCIQNHCVDTEDEPDMRLVEEAGLKLTEIISHHYENAMIEAGNYIVETFFANDIERARNKQATKEKSLYQLILYLQNQKNNAPSKSWLYNAVNLAVDHSDYKNYHLYTKLMLSHKIELLPIHNYELKKHLIKETVENNLTVSKLKDRINLVKNLPLEQLLPEKKIKNDKKSNKKHVPRLLKKNEKMGEVQLKRILSILNDPEKLFDEGAAKLFSQEALSNITFGKRRQIIRKLEKKHSEILTKIQELKAKILKNENYLQQYQSLMVEMERSVNKES
jgi:hypothetical protein